MATDRYTAQQVADALTAARGFVSVAAKNLQCSDETVRNYIKRYALCRQAVTDAREAMIDYAEGKLYQNIQNNDTVSILFFLKTQAKHRGYSERSQVEVTGPDGGAIRSDTTVTHTFDTDKAKEVLDILTLAGAFDVATEADSKSLDGAQSDA